MLIILKEDVIKAINLRNISQKLKNKMYKKKYN